MIRLLSISLLALSALTFTACTSSNNKVEMAGVPGWLARGAQIGDEPAPAKPDPALIDFKDESGPVEFFLVTDVRNYPLAKPKKQSTKKELELERGRDRRIKRLFY